MLTFAALFPYVRTCVVRAWCVHVRYARYYWDPSIAQARICMHHAYELLLVVIKMDGAHICLNGNISYVKAQVTDLWSISGAKTRGGYSHTWAW